MTAITTWQTDDSCPGCGAAIVAEVPGRVDGLVRQECRSCGWAVTWDVSPAGGER